MSFSMQDALRLCTATLNNRAQTRSNAYVLYYANEADRKNNRYTGKVHAVTIPEGLRMVEEEGKFPYIFVWSIKQERMIRFSTPANMGYSKKTGLRKLAMVPTS